jgi:hypothetical protein
MSRVYWERDGPRQARRRREPWGKRNTRRGPGIERNALVPQDVGEEDTKDILRVYRKHRNEFTCERRTFAEETGRRKSTSKVTFLPKTRQI